MKRGKRAEELEFTTVIDLVLIAIVAGILFFFISDVASNSYFEKSYVARDLALTIGAVQARPGAVYYNYTNDKLASYNIKFDRSIIKVYKQGDELPGLYSFYSNNRSKIVLSEIKSNKHIQLAGCTTGLAAGPLPVKCPRACPKADKAGQGSLMLFSLSKPSLNLIEGLQAAHADRLADYLLRSQGTFGEGHMRKDDETANSDLAIGIKSTAADAPYFRLTYKLKSPASEAIACRIEAALKDRFPDVPIRAYPGNDANFAKAGIIIEAGSPVKEDVLLPKDVSLVAGAINTGLRDFYAE